jgi:hypothetical protein
MAVSLHGCITGIMSVIRLLKQKVHQQLIQAF